MAKIISNVELTQTFSAWVDKTNETASAFANAVTVDALFPIGTAGVNGTFIANTLTVTTGLLTANASATINGTANVTVVLNVGANVTANTSSLKIGNSSVNSIITANTASLGNTTVTGFINVSTTANVGGAVNLRDTLTVNGAVTIANTLSSGNTSTANLSVTGFANVSGAANVGGATNLRSTLTVNGAVTIANSLSSGNTSTADLSVTGFANVSGAANVGGATNLRSTLAVNGAVTIANTLTITNTTTVSSDLIVSGFANVAGNANVGGATFLRSTLGVNGAVTIANTLTVTGFANVAGAANVGGATNLRSTLAVNGAVTIANTLSVTNVATISSDLIVSGYANVAGNANVGGATFLRSTLGVTGAATLSNTLSVSNTSTLTDLVVSGFANVAGNANVGGATFLRNTLAVTGAATLSNTLSVANTSTLTDLVVSGFANVAGAANVGGATTLRGTLGVTGAATISNTLSAGNTTVANLTVSGVINRNPVITLGGDLTGSVTLTDLQNGTLTATIAADSVALGTDTTGNYVATITAGAGISGSSSGEGGTPTIAVVANSGIIANANGVFVKANTGLVVNSDGLFVQPNTGIVVNANGVFVNAAYIATISANNASNLGGELPAYYTNATNISTGTLAVARGGTGVGTSTGTGSVVLSASPTFTGDAGFANITITGIINANGSTGSADQVLRTDGTGKVYWANPLLAGDTGFIEDVSNGVGLSKGGTSKIPSLAVIANSGIIANANGVFVNASSIADGTLPVGRGGTGVTTANGTGSVIRQTDAVFLANTTIAKLVANGSLGTSGQVLVSNSTGGVYWDAPPGTGDITGVTAGNGLTGGGASGEVTLSVVANSGIIVNANGVFVNASSVAVGTLPVARGGTGATTFTSGALLKGNGTAAVSNASAADIVAAIGTALVANATYADSSGTATNATRATASNNSLVVNDTTTAGTFYPVWVGATSGDQAIKISSTKLSFNPSTGVLTATAFSGSGASLTSLDAGNISSGTLAIARGGTGAGDAAAARTNLGATTLGGNIFTITNPSAITFPRFNSDNTISALSAADFRTAIGETDTTYDLLSVANTQTNKGILRLDPSSGANDDVFFVGANGVVVTSNGSQITITGEVDTNTTYDLLTVANTTQGVVRLDPSAGSNDDINFVGANGVVVTSDGSGTVTITGQTGDITSVTAGNGLTGTATSGDVTLNVVAANGISVAADSVGVTTGSTLTVNTSGIHVNSALQITDLELSGNLTISGNLTVNGTTTTINSTTISVDDKNIELGNTASPSDASADGGGITLKGTSDKTFNWVDATDAWTSSEHMNLLTGKAYYINGTSVLSSTTLGSGVTGSSLTSVGTIGIGVWQGTAVAVAYGGTGATSAPAARTNLGATTLGSNIFTITNPGAITFPRFNADNTISSLSATDFRTAIGAGTSSTTGTVTSVASGNGITGGTITSTGTLSVLANTGVVSNTSGVHIGQDVATTAGVRFANVTIQNNATYGILNLVAVGNSTVAEANITFTSNTLATFGIGTATTAGNSSPALVLRTGDATGTGSPGNISLLPGSKQTGTSSSLTLRAGEQTNTTSGTGGTLLIVAGDHTGGGGGGTDVLGGGITIRGGSISNTNATTTNKKPGSVIIEGGFSANATGLVAPYIHIGATNPLSNIVIGSTTSGNTIIYANGSVGTAGQVLHSNGSSAYWSNTTADITAVTAGDGLTGGGTDGSVTLNVGAGVGISVAADSVAVNAQTGLLANTSGLYVNASSIALGTLPVARGGTGATTESGARTALGATTLGSNIFTITNPSAVSFLRFNADNTVSALSDSAFRAAIGAGTSSTTGTVTSVANGSGLSGGTITSTGTLSVDSTVMRTNLGSTTQQNVSGITQVTGTLIDNNHFMTIALSDEDTAITTGTAKITFRAPYAMDLYQIPRASLSTASSSGIPTVDINVGGSTILSTKLTIDANEKTSTTAAAAAVLSSTSIADDAEITMDIDVAGTGAKGLKVVLYYRRTNPVA